MNSLKEYLEYNISDSRVRIKGTNKVLYRDESGYFRFKIKSKSYNIKAINLVWFLNNLELNKSTHCLYFKDTDPENLSINNISILSKQEYRNLKEALQNIQSVLKVQKHTKDMYTYWLYYKQNGTVKKKLYHDFSVAEKNRRKKYLENLKIVFKYCNVTS
jgi:uncharacterized protein YegP (UPF0339 family)